MSSDMLSINVRLPRGAFVLEVESEIPLTGVTALFGPSGSGKTSLLRIIAGFERPEHGRLACVKEVWFDIEGSICVPPHKRGVGMLFQDGRLFTHLDVRGNLAYAERRARQTRSALEPDHIRAVLDVAPLLDRPVSALSGGERQRVALARTLASGPRLLLLDEPLAALDEQRKSEILPYLERLSREFEIPVIYVSHDIDEVAHVADRVMVLSRGRVQASGDVAGILARLDLEPLTGRFEAGVLLEGTVTGHDDRLKMTRVRVGERALTVPYAPGLAAGEAVRLRIRARDVAVATLPPQGLSIRNVLPGTVEALTVDDDTAAAELVIDVGGPKLRARLTLAAVEELELKPGKSVFALVKTASLEGSLAAH